MALTERGDELAATGRVRRFRPDVEGLRGVAILLVVLYHVPVRQVSGGFVGVDVFFVISGFLITGQLVRELRARQRISFFEFYARRARRILPAATLAVMVTVVASTLLLNPLAAERALGDGLSAVYFGANFHFAAQGADYFNTGLSPSPLLHYWSLSVEEQFYILWPLLLLVSSLVWVAWRKGSRGARQTSPRRPLLPVVFLVTVGVAAISLYASIHQAALNPSWAYFVIFTRAWELAVGALVALALPLTRRLDRRLALPLSWAGLGCIVIAATSFSHSTAYPGDAALLPVLGAAAVIVGGSGPTRGWGAQTLLGTPPFQRLGSWSYSWYLWHWPALVLAPAILGHSLTELEGLATAGVALVIAVVSFVLVERPVRRLQIVVRRPAVGLTCAGALAGGTIGIVAISGLLVGPLVAPNAGDARALSTDPPLTQLHLTADLIQGARTTKVPSSLRPSLSTVTSHSTLPRIIDDGCEAGFGREQIKPCIYGDRDSHTTAVLFGDSHAGHWFDALNLISNQRHWRLIVITKEGCTPAEVIVQEAQSDACTDWREKAKARIARLHPALVIVSWARWMKAWARPKAGVPARYGGPWRDGVAAIFAFLRRSAKHVIFISDTPYPKHSVPDCVAGHLSDVRPCTRRRRDSTVFPAIKAAELRIAKQKQITSIDPTSWFCAPKICPVIVGNILVFHDKSHMTTAWSRFVAPVLAAKLPPLISRAAH